MINLNETELKIYRDQAVYILALLHQGFPVIAWDWDMTLSVNGVFALPNLIDTMEKLTKYNGFRHIISTGRIKKVEPMTISGDILKIPVFFNVNKGSSWRFKIWILKNLYNEGNGVLRLYVDNDEALLDMLRKINIPVCSASSSDYHWFVDQMEVLRKIEGREREKRYS